MDPRRTDADAETPAALLDALRAHPEWSERQRDDVVDRLIARFPAEQLVAAVRPRLAALDGADAETLLRLIEAHAAPDLVRALAEALIDQPGLAPERAWDALALLEGLGALDEHPELAERWEELNEALDEDGSIEQLAEQLERDPEQAVLAIQGLEAVEPEFRAEIVAGLARAPLGPGVIRFLRLLCFAHDLESRAAALDVLEAHPSDDPRLAEVWAEIAADHPDPVIAARARLRLGSSGELVVAGQGERRGVERSGPRVVRSLVTEVDGRGQATIVLSSRSGPTGAAAAFLCDVRRGVSDVYGQADPDPGAADAVFEEYAARGDRDRVEEVPELAAALLGGSLLLCGAEAPPALRRWLDETVGPSFRPRPFPSPFPGWDPGSLPFDQTPDRARAVLSSCPTWLDDSELTREIAEELRLRYPGSSPDPRRDAGAYRYLFEHRLVDQLEVYRRMLFWMASFWQASGDEELGRSALALAWQLSDPQHAVPSHPFTIALTTRSLTAAQLARGHALSHERTPPPRRT